jgi:CRISPR-associated protein Cas2
MAKRAEYGKNKQICVISISRRTRLKFTSLFSATFLFSLLVPMRQHYLFAYDITCPRRQACVRRLLQSYAVGMQKSLFECWLTADELMQLNGKLSELLDSNDTLHYLALSQSDNEWLFSTTKPLRYDVFMVV